MVNPLKINVMVFTSKYTPEPTEPWRLKGREISFTKRV
jgi:hypothetical protein